MLNSVILMGRLVADPELRKTPSGLSVSAFRIAVQRTHNRDLTDWIDIVAWRQQAEFVTKYFQKGSMIIVEGSIQTRSYEDKNGNKRTAVEVTANQVHFAQSKSKESSNEPQQQNFSIGNMDDYEELDTDDGDLPF